MKYTPEINAQIMQLLQRKIYSGNGCIVITYAEMILNVFAEEYDGGLQLQLTEENALNGAENWKRASFGGNFLAYNRDLAQMFDADESDSEKLLNMQAEALQAAWKEIEKALKFFRACQQYNVNF